MRPKVGDGGRVRAYVVQAEIDRSPSGTLPTAEAEELTQLRQRVESLERERDMLLEAIAFFATQSEQSSDLWRRYRGAIR